MITITLAPEDALKREDALEMVNELAILEDEVRDLLPARVFIGEESHVDLGTAFAPHIHARLTRALAAELGS